MGVLRSGRRLRPETPPSQDKGKDPVEKQQEEEAGSDEEWDLLPVFIAMFEDGTFYKHWALYVEREKPYQDNSFICHIQGSGGHFRYTQSRKYARESRRIHTLYQIGWISEEHTQRFREICGSVPVRNDKGQNWNCQDWVLDAFNMLVDEEIIELVDGVNDRQIIRQMDGIVTA